MVSVTGKSVSTGALCILDKANSISICRAYFACYEALVQRHCQKNNMARTDISPVWAVAYGAAGGYALWAAIYPVDVIKSKLQTDSLDKSKAAYKGIVDCARKTWRTQGMSGFTNGLTPTLIRYAL